MFSGEKILSEYSHRDVEWSFDTRVKKFSTKSQKLCWLSENDRKKWKVSKNTRFTSKRSSGQVECSLHNPAEFFLTKKQNIFAQCPRVIKNWTFLKKNKLFLIFFLGKRRILFWKSRRNFFVKKIKCWLKIDRKNTFFPGKNFYSKISHRNVEWTFDTNVEIVSIKNRN